MLHLDTGRLLWYWCHRVQLATGARDWLSATIHLAPRYSRRHCFGRTGVVLVAKGSTSSRTTCSPRHSSVNSRSQLPVLHDSRIPALQSPLHSVSSSQQSLLVLLLPVIKTTCKLWIHYVLKDTQNAKPEVIVFNVEVFHAFFVVHSMQSSTTKRTVLILVLIDFGHACISLFDVRRLLKELNGLDATHSLAHNTTGNLLEMAVEIINDNPSVLEPRLEEPQALRKVSKVAPLSLTLTSQPTMILPDSPHRRSVVDSLQRITIERHRLFVSKMLELFYLAEFIVFIEYTEMIMPMIYSVYTFILPKRWNHEYYSFFEGHLGTKVLPKLTNISLYVLAEALSFLVLAVILWRHLRFSLVHQLAFNFESRHVSIQSKLIGWVIYIVQNAMMQYGAAYSFRFDSFDKDPQPLEHHLILIFRG